MENNQKSPIKLLYEQKKMTTNTIVVVIFCAFGVSIIANTVPDIFSLGKENSLYIGILLLAISGLLLSINIIKIMKSNISIFGCILYDSKNHNIIKPGNFSGN